METIVLRVKAQSARETPNNYKTATWCPISSDSSFPMSRKKVNPRNWLRLC